MAEVQVGALDPIGIFQQQIGDLIQITDAFEKHENLRAIDYLRAAHTVRENLNALMHVTISSIMSGPLHSDRVSPDDLAAHTQEMEADGSTHEERVERALHRIAKNFMIDTNDLPGFPDLPGEDD